MTWKWRKRVCSLVLGSLLIGLIPFGGVVALSSAGIAATANLETLGQSTRPIGEVAALTQPASNALLSTSDISTFNGKNIPTSYSNSSGQSLLPNGNILLTVTDDQFGASVFLYDVKSDIWTAKSRLSSSSRGQSTLLDGRVMVTGRKVSGNVVSFYNYLNDTWTSGASMANNLSGSYAQSTLKDGRVMVTGGETFSSSDRIDVSKDCQIYNPATNSWIQVAPLPVALFMHSQVTLNDGRVIVTGGIEASMWGSIDISNSPLPAPKPSSYVYDPDTNHWTTVAPMPTGLRGHQLSTLRNGKVLLTGGGSGNINSTAYLYDPIQNSWSMLTTNMPPRERHSQSILSDGRVIITGGFDGLKNDVTTKIYTINSADFEVIAPTTPSNLSSPSKTNTTINLNWIASTDNIAVTGYDIYNGSTLVGSTTGTTSYMVSNLIAGTFYTFTVKARDAAGNVSAASNALTISTYLPLCFLDYPSSSSTSKLSGIVNVSGWVLDNNGVEKVDIIVDGILMGQAIYGDTRDDIYSTYPAYNNHYAGFHYSLDTTSLNEGNHVISIRSTARNGVQTPVWSGTNFVIGNLDKRVNAYDQNGQLKRTDFPSGKSIEFQYDSNGNLIKKIIH
ncbi:Ig-like domain-containing protein [Paenibacillus sp. HWE-109]|uniref:Kelch repeat-containing protein n=1 Tax=Paenibacillus sp. HWE-109 TaxID=1306526 RepID=UPI001EDF24D2|nr:kelch repeat-containing protein [Paenibacillus sp. HWE-109]UKS27367.1 Ig-like domain-containing protein [Paenibacillus sp. HWE-109]